MVRPKLIGLAGLVLALSFVGTVTVSGQGHVALPRRGSVSENGEGVPHIRVPGYIHLDAMKEGQSTGAAPPLICDVTIAPGTSPRGGYLPLSSLGLPPIDGVGDDDVLDRTVPEFTFAGETYTKIGFSTNGYAIVDGFVGTWDNSINNQEFPSASRPNNVLAPFWTDLHPGWAGEMRIAVLSDDTDSWIVLDWEAVREWTTPNSNSFQIWIGVNGDGHPSEDISFAYGLIEGSGDLGYLTMGVENRYGDRGHNIYFNGTGTLPSNGTQLRVTTTSCLATRPVNLSTRMRVQTGDAIAIGGLIVAGGPTKNVLIRAIGPSLSGFGIAGALANPVLELHGPEGFDTVTNDNWRDTQEADIQASGLAPNNDLESAIYITLGREAYTAVVRGSGNTSGVALVEVYDLDGADRASLANLSTRAFVDTGDNIVIGGFILSDHGGTNRVVVRGIGPSLNVAGVPNALGDPVLELRDGNGGLVLANNDWQDDPSQAAIVQAAGLDPTHNKESAIAAVVPPGSYTTLLSGFNDSTGIGLVEVYNLGP